MDFKSCLWEIELFGFSKQNKSIVIFLIFTKLACIQVINIFFSQERTIQ
jgi:hypothetical protein